MLNAATVSQLTSELAAHEAATSEQVVVVTVPSLNGMTIEDFGYQLGRQWGIGQKDKNNGALFIVSRDDRKLRIEVGYGLEGKLTDAQSAVILNQIVTPAFRQNDFAGGISRGVAAIFEALNAEPGKGRPRVTLDIPGGPMGQMMNNGPLRMLIEHNWLAIFFIFILPVLWSFLRMIPFGRRQTQKRSGSMSSMILGGLAGWLLGGGRGGRGGGSGGGGGFGGGFGGGGGGGGFGGGGGGFGGGGASGGW